MLYLDTGVALRLLITEPLSAKVQSFVSERALPITFARLHELEFEAALQASLFRRALDGHEVAAAKAFLGDQLERGNFVRANLSLDDVFLGSFDLFPRVVPQTGCRTLGVMHIASARLLGVDEFVSTDKRQLKAASLIGLNVIDLSMI